ncbi:hypothetical protein HZQ24_01420 [Elizabethkingia anophelis]|uniref:hypothetical protein n=1 Tax=Elizabethkingia anophelis TaxID=1117645 RepID=UPI00099A7BDB|nr:hypothetical protein [Elizabethkingia anophelis]MCL1035243.1 hypothetical protein [Elizabethkingia anophelis]MCT3981700.1 hypothetical protein [Elizabethkingia anophelis]MCT4011003.1 hypothetical protein [Elizabethkingia anophelis]MCW2464158.1 hypothetical protein [Elizabethkingia anophelis]MCW2467841.1 hypothetical protein [Elizabethkingia anophelis]
MQKILISFFIILSISVFSQEYLNKNEKYDLELFNHLDSLIEKRNISVEEYLKFSKPFSKWDIQPLKDGKIWALDSIRSSSEISNFFWGGFSQRYQFTEKEAGEKPNQFLEQGHTDEKPNIDFLIKNINKFKTLSSLVSKSKNQIYVNQISLQRVDNLYKENDSYWTYLIPKNSPFPISTEIKTENKSKFTLEQEKILKLMVDIKVYALVKTKTGIFFLIDGFTDNSYGYYFSLIGNMEKDNHLFEIIMSKKITNEFFYYIAN